MRTRRTSPEHQQAVSARLARLSAELEAARTGGAAQRPAAGGEWWSDHTAVGAVPPALRVVGPEPGEERAEPTAPPPDPLPRVPSPGRHAARRAPRGAGLLPETLRGRVALGPGPLAVVAVLVAVGLAVTAWVVVRDDPEPPSLAAGSATGGPALLTLPSAATTGAATPAPGATAAGATGSVTVDVTGEVRRPGITVLDAGARVVDAIEAAGGPRRGVDLSTLNLARVLVDGEQVVVGATPAAAAVVPPAPGLGSSGSPAPGALVNINTASAAELETLPEVGPVTAAAIIEWRERNGGFTAVEELLEVDGIGEATLGQMAPHVTV